MRLMLNTPIQPDPEWIKEFANFLNKCKNKKQLNEAKKIFVEAYFQNIQDGMNPTEALKKAKSVALCFLMLQQ